MIRCARSVAVIMRAWMVGGAGRRRRIAVVAMTVVTARQRDDQEGEYGGETKDLHG
jgi:hypothetical protein